MARPQDCNCQCGQTILTCRCNTRTVFPPILYGTFGAGTTYNPFTGVYTTHDMCVDLPTDPVEFVYRDSNTLPCSSDLHCWSYTIGPIGVCEDFFHHSNPVTTSFLFFCQPSDTFDAINFGGLAIVNYHPTEVGGFDIANCCAPNGGCVCSTQPLATNNPYSSIVCKPFVVTWNAFALTTFACCSVCSDYPRDNNVVLSLVLTE